MRTVVMFQTAQAQLQVNQVDLQTRDDNEIATTAMASELRSKQMRQLHHLHHNGTTDPPSCRNQRQLRVTRGCLRRTPAGVNT